MISAKIRGSIVAVTAAAAAATVFMAPTVSADTKSVPSAAVVMDKDKDRDKDKDKDRDDEKRNCAPLLAQLLDRLRLAEDSLDSTPPAIPTARTALSQADRRLTALEDSKCLCLAEVDLLRERLDTAIGFLNATPVNVPEARESLASLLVVIEVLQAGETCRDGKCDVNGVMSDG
ncbi:hypothetical protein AB0K02_04545 [Streptomyces sp. NPDC049597]|uniref:hypothetical protein n=1 Tax=Streptomyces sp. NPDC049597 TaxID=3155276 RepID=UPI00343868D8